MPTLCLNSLTFCPCSHIFIIALKTGLWISLGRDRVSYSLLLPWPLGGTQYLVNVGWFDCKWKAASRQESMVVLIKAIHVSTFWVSFVEWAMRGYMKLMVQCGSIRKTFLCLILYSPLLYFNPSFCLTVGLEAKVRCSMWRQEVWMISCEWQRIWRNDGGENEQHAGAALGCGSTERAKCAYQRRRRARRCHRTITPKASSFLCGFLIRSTQEGPPMSVYRTVYQCCQE